ncbi:predicted protein [Coccidioides posadasii str. Silveira]|uniref:Predicted protein n=1 Tax=Coccidioides posadasii (strain RMSCC 757 / Silveira) TaxID=443226 RepID=E9DAL2_COCPS|nr:predicted protein [Coccidioides posadasii str. Silveira]
MLRLEPEESPIIEGSSGGATRDANTLNNAIATKEGACAHPIGMMQDNAV